MLEGQLEVGIPRVEVEQTTSVYQSNQRTLLTRLGHRVEEHCCTGLNIRQQGMIMVHFALSMTIMSHVQSAILQHEKLL